MVARVVKLLCGGYNIGMIEKIENIPDFIEDIFDGIMRDIERIAQDKLNELKAPFKGIDYMIQDFQRMLCWVKTLPVRIDLILNGIDNIFVGIGEQLEIYIQAFEMGVEETGTLANYSGALVKSYIACIEKFIVNLYKCFLYYMVDLFFKLLYLPVILILWIASLFGSNGYPMEESFWKTMKTLDAFVYNNAKFHILEFPESIKDDCYRCTRLRKEVVEYQANHLDRVFNEDIPKKLKSSKGVKTRKRGQKQFDEVIHVIFCKFFTNTTSRSKTKRQRSKNRRNTLGLFGGRISNPSTWIKHFWIFKICTISAHCIDG